MDDLREAMLSLFAAAGVDKRSATYVSTPITTGRNFATWHRLNVGLDRSRYMERLRSDIIQPNLVAAAPLVAAAERRWPTARVIDPTQLKDVPGWAQVDYHAFWCEAIGHYASRVVFAEGWSYSNGCALEFEAALVANLELFDHQMRPMGVGESLDLLEKSVNDLVQTGYDVASIHGVLTRLASRAHLGSS